VCSGPEKLQALCAQGSKMNVTPSTKVRQDGSIAKEPTINSISAFSQDQTIEQILR
jgi:hypothetical protein